MNVFAIAWKSIRQRLLASSLTALSVALGVMLMVAVLVIHGIIARSFDQRSVGYNLIVGPEGSDLQLVLSTIYRISPPIENMPYLYYKKIAAHPRVKEAVPIALGDVTQEGAFPIVGTVSRYFELPYSPGNNFRLTKESKGMGGGFDAIIGSKVAQTNGWKIGSTFQLVHGGIETGHVHDEKFTIVGILAPTGTPNDKTAFVNLEGFYQVEGHDKPADEAIEQLKKFLPDDERIQNLTVDDLASAGHDHHDHGHDGHDHAHHDHSIPDEMKEVTSVLLVMEGEDEADRSFAAISLTSELKSGYVAMAVNPMRPIRRLMDNFVGNIRTVLAILTALIIVVSGIGIFVSIYNSMSDRRKEIGIMRALGARRTTVFSVILAESVLLCVGGGLVGLLLGHAIVYLAAPIVEARSGLLIDPFSFERAELILFPVLLALGSLIGFVPGLTAYRTNVAEALAD